MDRIVWNKQFLQALSGLWVLTVISLMIIGSFSMYFTFQTSYAQLEDSGNLTSHSANCSENWTKYTSNKLGISFEYPAAWDIEEKKNRFDTGADVLVFNHSDNDKLKFVVLSSSKTGTTHDWLPSKVLWATEYMEETARNHGQTIIEATDVEKYKIGGEVTGTFLEKFDDPTSPTGVQHFIVVHGGDLYNLAFSASTDTFDNPDTQAIMNNIMQSFKFFVDTSCQKATSIPKAIPSVYNETLGYKSLFERTTNTKSFTPEEQAAINQRCNSFMDNYLSLSSGDKYWFLANC